MPIIVPQGTTVKIDGGKFMATGPKGELSFLLHPKVKVELRDKEIICFSEDNALWGLVRSLVANAVLGVSVGWSKTLELTGVGFRAETTGIELTLNIGFSHQVKIKAPPGLTFKVVENERSSSSNKIEILGADKQAVGELAAQIRRIKPPEPYKGKGIKYQGEIIRRKLGKAAKAIGGAGPTSSGAIGGKK